MIVINRKPLAIYEVKIYAKDVDEKSSITEYLRKFGKISKEKGQKIAEEIKALNNPKIKDENIMKIVDFMPEDAEDLNKIFTEISLTEEETNAILEIVKK